MTFQLFMCPGKREAPGPHLDCLEVPTETFAKIFRQSLRSPIYVHSKMMIVDDVYAIVGSANINQVFLLPNLSIENNLRLFINYVTQLWGEWAGGSVMLGQRAKGIERLQRGTVSKIVLHNWLMNPCMYANLGN